MNKVFLAGRLAADPELVIVKTGTSVCRISIACNDSISRNNDVYFISCVAWESKAKFISTYLKKGNPVIIEGRLQRKSYVNNEGKNIYTTDVVIDIIKSFGGSNNKREESHVFENASENDLTKISKKENTENQKVEFEEEKSENDSEIKNFDLDWLDELD